MKKHFALAALSIVGALAFAVLLGQVGGAQQAPSHDNFNFSREVVLGWSPPGGGYEDMASTTGATLEPGEPTCLPDAGSTVWYAFFPQASSDIVVDTTGSDFATFIGVYRVTSFVPSPPGSGLEQVTCSDATDGQARLQFAASVGPVGYAIQIGGVAGATGTLRVQVACTGCPPGNDDVLTATHLFRMPHFDFVDTSAATVEPDEPRPCANIGKTVWYWHETFSDNYTTTVAVNAEGFTPVIALYNVDFSQPSPPHGLVNVACVTGTSAGDASHTFETNQFTQYWVQVGGVDGAGGRAQVEFTCTRTNGTPCVFDVEGPENPSPGSGVATPGSGLVAGPDTGSGGHKAPRGR